ncbi:MAG: helix-turn-helix domain-containing protein [Candidatus Korobacteraceae bacterium]|jgi:excisionase family DNA binding protein
MDKQTKPSPRNTRCGWESERAPLLVSKRDAAALLSLCVRTVDNLIATKKLPARRVGRRVLIPYSALVHFARRDNVGSPEAAQ